ncbi:hypothetical protein TrLO_g545 [Triparma laevis f. longispina]|uniref:Uncharacterized protein n=1 Tax=Triparma laevis f. longispina TaxID=1714387 RepID=A0A9W7E727_9STRA|nr:hypothetical protein TrLO_g545 [Triparma laevis f. longispina]
MGVESGTKPSDFEDFFQQTIVRLITDQGATVVVDPGEEAPELAGSSECRSHLQNFLYWSNLKLPAPDVISLYLKCGLQLQSINELSTSTLLFSSCISKVESTPTAPTSTFLTLHKVQSIFSISSNTIKSLLSVDRNVKYPNTLKNLLKSLGEVRGGMEVILGMEDKDDREELSWLILNGTSLFYTTLSPLHTLGYSRQVLEYFNWSVLALESIVVTSATRHVPWRMRCYVGVVDCLVDLGRGEDAKAAVERMKVQIHKLRTEEELDPPLPLAVQTILSTAESDIAILEFKFKLLQPGDEVVESVDDVQNLLEEKIKEPSQYPKAIIESIVDYKERCLKCDIKEDDLTGGVALAVEWVCREVESEEMEEEEEEEEKSSRGSPRSPRSQKSSPRASEDGADANPDPNQTSTPKPPKPSKSQIFLANTPITLRVPLAKELYRLKKFSAFKIVLSSGLNYFQQISDQSDEVNFALENNLPPPPVSSEKTNLKGVITNKTKYEDVDADTEMVLSTELQLLKAVFELEDYDFNLPSTSNPDSPPSEEEPQDPNNSDLPLNTVELSRTPLPQYTAIDLPSTSKPMPLELFNALCSTLEKITQQRSTGPILTQRSDLLVDASMFLWYNYCKKLLEKLEDTETSNDLEPYVLECTVRALMVINSLFTRLDVDDILIRAEVGLRLSILLSDFISDPHRSVSVLRSTLNFLDNKRSELTSPTIHQPAYNDDTAALSRSSVTCEVDDLSAMMARGRLGARAYAGQGVFGAAGNLDPQNLAVAGLHTDLFITLCRVELELGREVTENHGRHISRLKTKRKREKQSKKKELKKSSAGGMAGSANNTAAMSTAGNTTANASNTQTLVSNGLASEALAYCQYTESIMLTECRKNNYQRALLQIEMAESRTNDLVELETILTDTMQLLHEAKQKEDELLTHVDMILSEEFATPTRNRAPPAPVMVSRSTNSITMTIKPFKLHGPHNSKLNPIHHIKLFGKPSGAGTDVSLNNTDFPGTGVAIPFDPQTYSSPPITVTGLPTNDSYVFAVAAFDESGEIIGRLGQMCTPIEALNPLPLPLIWSYLGKRALALGCDRIATESSYTVVAGAITRASENSHSNLGRGWEAKPMNGISFKPSIIDRMPDVLLQAFIDSTCVYVDSREQPDVATISGQIETLKTAKLLQLATIVSSMADDHRMLTECVYRAYHVLIPILQLQQSSPYTIQCLLGLQQAMLLVPKTSWDDAMHSVFACLSHQISQSGDILAETTAMKFSLFDGDHTGQESATEEQKALFDVWQGLAGFGSTTDEQLIKSVGLPKPLPPAPTFDDEGNEIPPPEDTDLNPLGEFVINREIGRLLLTSKDAALSTLKEKFASDPSYLRFFTKLCGAYIVSSDFEKASAELSEFVFKKHEATPHVLEVLECEVTGLPDYVKNENEDENEDATPSTPNRRKLMSTGGSSIFGGGGEEEPSPTDRVPDPEDKQTLMALAEVEVLLALNDYNDAMAFGTDYLTKNNLATPNMIGKAASGLTTVVASLSPSFADGVESDLSLEVEDVDMEADPDPIEPKVEEETVRSRAELIAKSAEHAENPPDPDNDEAEDLYVLDNKIAAMQAFGSGFLRLSKAAWRSRCARSWTKLIVSCQHIWNGVTSVSLPPHLFSRDVVVDVELRLDPYSFLRTATYLLDMVEILKCFKKDVGDEESVLEGLEDVNEDQQGISNTTAIVQSGLTGTSPGYTTGFGTLDADGIDKTTIDLDWVCQYVLYSLKTLCCARRWMECVELGKRLNRLTNNRVAGSSFPIVVVAQERLVKRAERKLEVRIGDRDKFVHDFETEQAKKPKRRYRVAAKVEKTDEERAFDKGRIKLENKVSDARGELRILEQRLTQINDDEEVYRKAKSSALESLHVARHQMMKFIHLLDDPNVDNESAVRGIMVKYNRTIALLRDKREKEPLVEALQDCGDFHLTLGNVGDANKSWCDGIDALFNTLDAYKHWRTLLADMGEAGDGGDYSSAGIVNELTVEGCLVGGVLLGKLAKFCCSTDQDRRTNHALLAAELFRAPFSVSLPNPQRLCDFASYSPSQFCIGVNLFSDERALDPSTMVISLTEVAAVLIEGGYYAQALPVICLNEWIFCYQSMNIDGLTRTRIQKVEACVGAGFVAEGVSILACILKGEKLPKVAGGYCGVPNNSSTKSSDEEVKEEGEEGETRPALNFYGLSPFLNEASVCDEKNAEAVKWISGGSKTDGEDSSPAFALTDELAEIYGEDVTDLVSIVRVKLMLGLIENEKLPIVKNGAVEQTPLFTSLRKNAGAVVDELQTKIMHRIATSAVYVRPEEKKPETPNPEEKKGEDDEETEEQKKPEETEPEPPQPRLATEACIKKATTCIIFKAKIALTVRKFKEARKYAGTGLALMTRCSGGGMCLEETDLVNIGHMDRIKISVDSKQWLECKWILAKCALSQGRLDAVRDVAASGVQEGREVGEGIWSRRLKTLAVFASIQQGADEAEGEGRALVMEFLEADSTEFDFVTALVVLSNILCQKALGLRSLEAYDCFKESRALLEDGEKYMMKLAVQGGWIGNCPLTYDDIRTNEMGAEVKAPLSTALAAFEFENGFVAVVDNNDETAPTPLSNLYLRSVRWLSYLRGKVGQTLGASVPRAIPVDLNSLGEDFEMVVQEDREDLRGKSVRKCELGLATMRFVGVIHPVIRGDMLRQLGVGRMQNVVESEEEELNEAAFKDASDALTGSLSVYEGSAGYARLLMKDACSHLCNLYGNVAGMEGGSNDKLKVAIHFLVLAADLCAKHKYLNFNVMELCDGLGELPADLMEKIRENVIGETVRENGQVKYSDIIYHFLSLLRERDFVAFDESINSDIIRLHSVLFESFEAYREKCCVERGRIGMPPASEEEGEGVVVEVKNCLVCNQWYGYDPEDLVLDESQGVDPDLHPYVSLMMVVGCGDGGDGGDGGGGKGGKKGKGGKGGKAGGGEEEGFNVSAKMASRFGEAVGPLLICRQEVVVKVREVRAMKERASLMRKTLEDFHRLKKSKEVPPAAGLISTYVKFIKDMLVMLGTRHSSELGGDGEVLDSVGEPLGLPLNVECLMLLEGFFDVEYGCTGQSVEYAYMLRDLFGSGVGSCEGVGGGD